jgi:hypothetical protein
MSKTNVSSHVRKPSKRNFANKFGKSFLNFKSTMSKAFHPAFSSTENMQYSNAINMSSQTINQHDSPKAFQSNFLTDCLKSLQDEIRILKELIDKKQNLLTTLTITSNEERRKYEEENMQLKQKIEQLQFENSQLKARYQSDT